MSALPASVRKEVERILAAEARRLLAQELTPNDKPATTGRPLRRNDDGFNVSDRTEPEARRSAARVRALHA